MTGTGAPRDRGTAPGHEGAAEVPASQVSPESQAAHPQVGDPRAARRVTRQWPLISGVLAIALVAVAGALIVFRESNVEFDMEWMEELVENRSPYWEVPARLMDFIGGGWFGVLAVPLGVPLLLLLAKRRWAALYFLIASVVSAGLVQLLKHTFGRARPEDILVTSDFGSFPSGHVGNAATIAVALGLIMHRGWVWFAGAAYTVLMLLSRTYLGAHWLSDTLGGLVLGAGAALIVWAPFASRLQRERARHTVVPLRARFGPGG